MRNEAELTRQTQKSAQTELETAPHPPTQTPGRVKVRRTQPFLPSPEVLMLGSVLSTLTQPLDVQEWWAEGQEGREK